MNGFSPTTLVTGLKRPWDITIDFKTSTLFWADYSAHKIESSNLEEGDRRTIVNLSSGAYPTGIAIVNGRVYWGESGTKKLQSSTFDGKDVITLHTDANYIRGVTVVPDLNRPQNRTNHCAENNCSKACVLTATSSRCLN